MLHLQNDAVAQARYADKQFQCQVDFDKYTFTRATLTRKGAPSDYRICATLHLPMGKLIEIVKYDPANPLAADYQAQGMREAHERTQSDFKGQKKENTVDYADYLLEGLRGERQLNLPTVSGWQAKGVFPDTVFAAWDESDPSAMYGDLYIPKAPIMESDGQTLTAALFRVSRLQEGVDLGALDKLFVTLELEFNVNERAAGQSFADRNGRGSKKNLNLVKNLDVSAAMSRLRAEVIPGTIFQDRLADGRSGGTSETATKNIVDLSTMEQLMLLVVSGGTLKPENIKHHHLEHLKPFVKEFLELLETQFGPAWVERTPSGSEPFRRLFVHSCSFGLKALAQAYHKCRLDQITPHLRTIRSEHEIQDATIPASERYKRRLERVQEELRETPSPRPDVTFEDFKDRLKKIDWYRHRKHWIELTGFAMKGGAKKTREIRIDGVKQWVAVGLAQNTPAVISNVCGKILGPDWRDLMRHDNEPISEERTSVPPSSTSGSTTSVMPGATGTPSG